MAIVNYEGDKEMVYSAAGRGETFADVLARRLSRRRVLKGTVAGSAMVLAAPVLRAAGQAGTPAVGTPVGTPGGTPGASPTAGIAGSDLGFEAITLDSGDETLVANGYRARPLLKWGDPLFADAPEFDAANQTGAAQARQFGYNCDWMGFFPLPRGSESSDHGLLVVNHEYTNPELMFAGYATEVPEGEEPEGPTIEAGDLVLVPNPTQEIVDVQLEAHGLSIVEIRRDEAGEWEVVRDSRYNRRLTATTPMELTGPAAGSEWTTTTADPTGRAVSGTLNNCAGGVTPWGTVVTGEENFQQYFGNLAALAADDPARRSHERFGIQEESSNRLWENYYDRFDLAKEPNEPFRFGWGVEFDPYDPESTPKKRTTLGRNKHEGHTSFVAPEGQVAIYSGDDERFEYAYKFVTAGRFDESNRAANMDLLDEGTLHVAKFNDDGSGEWLPLDYGESGLTEENGFASQADVLVNTRFAADAVGATKMDRPEDFETNPVTGKVYLVCTNNDRRTFDEIVLANPRPQNIHGHIVEITEEGNDHAGTGFAWEMFLLAGDPANGSTWFAGFDTELVSPISAPDNLTFDLSGNIWISTDGNRLDANDGLYAAPTEGEERGYVKQFFSSVPGAEVSGPVFTPDNTSLFTSVQHPGEGGIYEAPLSRWPDGDLPPRPSVVVIQADDATARIGTRRA